MGGLRQVSVFGPGVTMMSCEWMNAVHVLTSATSRRLCEHQYGHSPRVRINGHVAARFPFIPLPLDYILPELLKNAMRYHHLLNSWYTRGDFESRPLGGGASFPSSKSWSSEVTHVRASFSTGVLKVLSTAQVHCSHQESLMTVFFIQFLHSVCFFNFILFPKHLSGWIFTFVSGAFRATMETHLSTPYNVPDVGVTIANNDIDFVIRWVKGCPINARMECRPAWFEASSAARHTETDSGSMVVSSLTGFQTEEVEFLTTLSTKLWITTSALLRKALRTPAWATCSTTSLTVGTSPTPCTGKTPVQLQSFSHEIKWLVVQILWEV